MRLAQDTHANTVRTAVAVEEVGATRSLPVHWGSLTVLTVHGLALQVLPLVVMLNKVDLFERQLRQGVRFREFVSDCPKEVKNECGDILNWLETAIADSKTFLTAPHAKVTCFATCATDTKAAKKMISRTFEAILAENMAGGYDW